MSHRRTGWILGEAKGKMICRMMRMVMSVRGGGTGRAGGALVPPKIYEGGHCSHTFCSSSMPEQYGNMIIRQKTYLHA